MRFEVLFVSPTSACFELVNDEVYYSSKKYDVYLNGKLALKDVETNVFSLYNLLPNRDYEVRVENDSLNIHTNNVSCIIHSSQFRNDSKTNDDTLMLQAAINVLPKDGLLVIDPGEYHITSLFLKSDMNLEISKGVKLLANNDVDAYPLIPGEVDAYDSDNKIQLVTWEGNPFITKSSIITGFHLKNVNIVGEGCIDGQAQNSTFWKDVKKLPWGRPRDIFFNDCENLNVHGISVCNTPCWTIHPYFCTHTGWYDLTISNPATGAPNTDGMDPESCEDIKIIGVKFSVGDDCIAVKSGKYYIGKTYKKPTKDLVIRNCYMNRGHGGVVLGSEIGAGTKDIQVERCIFEGTDRGLRIKTRRGRGKDSVIDGIVFKNIIMKGVLTPLVVNMFYFCDPDGKTEYVWSKEKLPVDDKTPYIGSFVFDNIHASDAEYALGWFYGLPEQPIASITIKNSSFTMKEDAGKGMPAMMSYIDEQSKTGFYFNNVGKVVFDNVKASGFTGEKVILNNVSSFKEE